MTFHRTKRRHFSKIPALLLTGASLLPLAGSIGSFAPRAQANPACGQLAGSVMFQDMLYGMGAGTILYGLYMGFKDNYDDARQKLSAGALTGSTIGIGVGAFESIARSCHTETGGMKVQTGWQPPRAKSLVMHDRQAMGFEMGWRF